VRQLPERERRFQVDRFVPIVERLADNEQGRRDLAAVCAAYLKEHRPETTVKPVPAAPKASDADAPENRPPERRGRRPRRGGRKPRR
jgi:hypothetical protein